MKNVLVLALVLIVPALGFAQDAASSDIVETAKAADGFSTLVAALEAADLVDTLKGDGPFTVFAPTDAAFAALPEGTLDRLLSDPEALRNVLLYHVVPGEVPAAEVLGAENVETVSGGQLDISIDGNTVTVNDATVVATDVRASNGIIHVIDAVLVP